MPSGAECGRMESEGGMVSLLHVASEVTFGRGENVSPMCRLRVLFGISDAWDEIITFISGEERGRQGEEEQRERGMLTFHTA